MKIVGRFLFWFTWPLIWIYAPLFLRPRAMIICGDEFLAVKPYFGSGAWQLPGGGMHSAEPPIHAAARELAEETGIKLDAEVFVPLLPSRFFKETGLLLHYCIFVAKISQKPEVAIQKKEIGDYAWLPLFNKASSYPAHIRESIAAFVKAK